MSSRSQDISLISIDYDYESISSQETMEMKSSSKRYPTKATGGISNEAYVHEAGEGSANDIGPAVLCSSSLHSSYTSKMTQSTACFTDENYNDEANDETALLVDEPAVDYDSEEELEFTLDDLSYEFHVVESKQKLYSVEDCFNDSRRLIKALLAAGLFSAILICLIVSRGSILFITSQMNPHVMFKRTGTVNETFIPKNTAASDSVGSTFGTSPRDDFIDCSQGPSGSCEQCGVPVCLEENDELCTQKETIRWIWSMFLCQCVPYFIMFMKCFWKIGFKKKTNPTIGVFCIVASIESLYTIGVFLFLYIVLPKLDATRGLLLFSGTAFIPSVLKIFNRPKNENRRNLNIIIDILVFFGQISALITWIIISDVTNGFGKDYYEDMNQVCLATESLSTVNPTTDELTTILDDLNTTQGNNFTSESVISTTELPVLPDDNNTSIDYKFTQIGELPENWDDLILIPISLLLISLGYWENFLDNSSKLSSFGKVLNQFRKSHWQSSTKIYLGISLMKILLTFVLLVIQHSFYDDKITVDMLFNTSMFYDNKCDHFDNIHERGRFQSDWLEIALIQIFVGVLCFYVSDMAIKGQMQVASFSIPLLISTPITFCFLYWACVDCQNGWQFGTQYYWNCYAGQSNFGDLMTERYVWIGFFWWISFIFLTRYLLQPKIERLAKLDRIFTYPMPDGTMLEQSLMLIRRRNDEEKLYKKDKTKKKQETKANVKEETSSGTSKKSPKSDVSHEKNKKGITGPLKTGYVPTILDESPEIPFVYMCATMWHENEKEMLQILKSLFRMNEDQCAKQIARDLAGATNIDFYRFEAHIFFDDAFEPHKPEQKTGYKVNSFVKKFVKIMNEAASSVLNKSINLSVPLMCETPYGGRLMWTFPKRDNKLVMHLKDKQLIRNRKRWSQIMYLHRVLGLGIMDQPITDNRRKVLANNTFVLALDGDVDFKPEAVMLLLDLMKRNTKVAAACGRIHPIGNGEDRWLCTLLLQQGYRVEYSAAADAYTYAPEEFNEFYNQRRRWITSTFANLMDLLTTGRRTANKNENISLFYIFYQALLFAASILGPATIFMLIVGALEEAFEIDSLVSFCVGLALMTFYMILCFKASAAIQLKFASLLSVFLAVVQMLVIVGISQRMVNDGICSPSSVFFLFVLSSFLLCSILHPQEFFNLFHGFLYYLLVPSMYLLLIIYSLCNLHVVSWGTREIKQSPSEKDLDEKKKEEEMLKKLSPLDQIKAVMNSSSKSANSASLGIDCLPCCLLKCCAHGENKTIADESIEVKLKELNTQKEQPNGQSPKTSEPIVQKEENTSQSPLIVTNTPRDYSDIVLDNHDPELSAQESNWTEDDDLPSAPGSKVKLDPYESKYWEIVIRKFLKPLDLSKQEKDEMTQSLMQLRNKAVFTFFLIDILLMVLILGLTKSGLNIPWECNGIESDLDPVGLAFVFVFGSVLGLQVLGMLVHRLFTFLQIISTTFICGEKSNQNTSSVNDEKSKDNDPTRHFNDDQVLEFVRTMQRVDIDDQESETICNTEDLSEGNSSSEEFDNDEKSHTKNITKKVAKKQKVLDQEEVDKLLAARYVALSSEVYSSTGIQDSADYNERVNPETGLQERTRKISVMDDFKNRGKELINEKKIEEWGKRVNLSSDDIKKGKATLRRLVMNSRRPIIQQGYSEMLKNDFEKGVNTPV